MHRRCMALRVRFIDVITDDGIPLLSSVRLKPALSSTIRGGREYLRLRLMYAIVLSSRSESRLEIEVAKKAPRKKVARKEYAASDIKLLKMHSKARTPVSKLAKLMKRSEGSLRQKALRLGIGLGHQR
jgi:hypothetical protein